MGRGETNAKKRKRQAEAKSTPNSKPEVVEQLHVHAPILEDAQSVRVPSIAQGRNWTLSIALPGSLLANATDQVQQTALIEQISRALGVFSVDEVVVFNDGGKRDASHDHLNQLLIHLLSYFETPPHLRTLLFPPHPNIEFANSRPTSDLPHHHINDAWSPYREGVTLPGASEQGTPVEVGLRKPVIVDAQIPENTRVTLKFNKKDRDSGSTATAKALSAEPVSPDEPREAAGLYWGFKVRKTENLSSVFTECEYEDGYDVSIGVSEQGLSLDELYDDHDDHRIDSFKHMLVVFAGTLGLQDVVKKDPEFEKLGVTDAKDVFDRWVNVFTGSSNCQLRTEEAIWIGMAGLRKLVIRNS